MSKHSIPQNCVRCESPTYNKDKICAKCQTSLRNLKFDLKMLEDFKDANFMQFIHYYEN